MGDASINIDSFQSIGIPFFGRLISYCVVLSRIMIVLFITISIDILTIVPIVVAT